MRRLKPLWDSRRVLGILIKRDLRVRYAKSFIGYLWTIIDPLMSALIYFVLFTYIFKLRDVGLYPYILFLLTGQLAWQWFNASVSESTRAFLTEAQLIRSTRLPREIWVIRVVVAKGLEYVFSLPALLLFLGYYIYKGETSLHWGILWLPVGVLVMFLLLFGIGLVLASLTVVVDDLQPIIRIILRIQFYMTPVIYSLSIVPEKLRLVAQLNPMTGIMEFFRAGLFRDPVTGAPVPIDWVPVSFSLAITAIAVFGGYFVFKRMERIVLKEI